MATSSVSPVPVPHPKQIRDVLLALTGRDVEVGIAHPVMPGRDPATVSVYVTDELATGALIACDLSLAASVAAALGLMPLPQVNEALAEGRLSDDLVDNLHEVVNILASVFNETPGAPQLELHTLHTVGEQLPADVASMLCYVVRRLDLQVDVAGYGGGRMSIVAVG